MITSAVFFVLFSTFTYCYPPLTLSPGPSLASAVPHLQACQGPPRIQVPPNGCRGRGVFLREEPARLGAEGRGAGRWGSGARVAGGRGRELGLAEPRGRLVTLPGGGGGEGRGQSRGPGSSLGSAPHSLCLVFRDSGAMPSSGKGRFSALCPQW